MDYKLDIGLEIHVEILTKTKMFCRCRSNFGDKINTNICPICTGQAGSLPSPNKKALELAIKTGTATNCTINKEVSFDRKNYFYKDLPNGYQITQFFNPIGLEGYLNLADKKIKIKEIHMEEDAGKVYIDKIDYNRAGIPLLEIVTYPDFDNAEQVIEFLRKLKEILIFLNISDGKIQESSMRVDVNLSVRKNNNKILGNRVEIKNIGSFKSIRDAIEYEKNRHIGLLEKGETINIETRRFSEDEGKTIFMRNKESILEYRYFKEPNIKPIYLKEDFIREIRKSISILPEQIRKKYKEDLNLRDKEIDILLSKRKTYYIFENLYKNINKPKEVSNFIIEDLLKILNQNEMDIENTNINLEYIEILMKAFFEENINRNIYKEVLEKIIIENIEPLEYIKENNLFLIKDRNLISVVVDKIINENKETIEDYKRGKEKALKFLIGQTMKEFLGKSSSIVIEEVLIERIKK